MPPTVTRAAFIGACAAASVFAACLAAFVFQPANSSSILGYLLPTDLDRVPTAIIENRALMGAVWTVGGAFIAGFIAWLSADA